MPISISLTIAPSLPLRIHVHNERSAEWNACWPFQPVGRATRWEGDKTRVAHPERERRLVQLSRESDREWYQDPLCWKTARKSFHWNAIMKSHNATGRWWWEDWISYYHLWWIIISDIFFFSFHWTNIAPYWDLLQINIHKGLWRIKATFRGCCCWIFWCIMLKCTLQSITAECNM